MDSDKPEKHFNSLKPDLLQIRSTAESHQTNQTLRVFSGLKCWLKNAAS